MCARPMVKVERSGWRCERSSSVIRWQPRLREVSENERCRYWVMAGGRAAGDDEWVVSDCD